MISVYIINLEERTDRLRHILRQFEGKTEFSTQIVKAVRNSVGALGLFESLKQCVRDARKNEHDLVIVCEDDHTFHTHYSAPNLLNAISIGLRDNFDILLGGVSGFENAIYY